MVDQKNVFKVRVKLQGVDPLGKDRHLMPGREAVAKIDIDKRSYGWIWTHQLIDWVRMKLWL